LKNNDYSGARNFYEISLTYWPNPKIENSFSQTDKLEQSIL